MPLKHRDYSLFATLHMMVFSRLVRLPCSRAQGHVHSRSFVECYSFAVKRHPNNPSRLAAYCKREPLPCKAALSGTLHPAPRLTSSASAPRWPGLTGVATIVEPHLPVERAYLLNTVHVSMPSQARTTGTRCPDDAGELWKQPFSHYIKP